MATYEIIENEMSVMNTQTMSEQIAGLIGRMNTLGLSGKDMPAIMLWGAPGVGKSQGVRQAAGQVECMTGKQVNVTDVRLVLFNPVDLRGIPVADSERRFAVWLQPRIFEMDRSENVINILFLDELTAAPQSVQAAAYQITLDRRVGEHQLPENCVVIAAGNRTTDRSVSFKMPKALANRLCHIEIQADFTAWRKWALSHGIDVSIIGYLSFDPDSLMKYGSVDDELAFPTPRSWVMASNAIRLCGSVETAMPFIEGCVGRKTATSLMAWIKLWSRLPDMEKIFSGSDVEYVKRPDLMYALVSQMIAYARRSETDIYHIRKSVPFGTRLPADFAMLLFCGYMALEGKCSGDMRSELLKEPSFREWLNKNERSLNL